MDPSDHNFYRNPARNYPVIDRTAGVYIHDEKGQQFIDFGSGIGVTAIGGGVRAVVDKITQQLEKSTFAFNGYFSNRPRIELSQQLAQHGIESRLLHEASIGGRCDDEASWYGEPGLRHLAQIGALPTDER